ncbi:Tyrosine-protein kinase STYK1 [Oryzias melastigma]|uniref:Tyrosine-protein kinase STYK1 n=1 Tax=Oryzias melastigma TaxID=30732 RepID=A0A834CXG9_ORYME|nr:Tyrosine-protein kinase STYK1 [Oryzias melastigma]
MTSNTTDSVCASDDRLCITLNYELELIVVPAILLILTVFTVLTVILLKVCSRGERTQDRTPQYLHQNPRRSSHRHQNSHRRHLKGIDAPPGINPLEHEEVPMTVQQNVKPTRAAAALNPTPRQEGGFGHVTALPVRFSIKPNETVSYFRARMDNRNVVLRVLKENPSNSEKQDFMGFASFLSSLGPHPFIPALLGVVSMQSPLVLVVEELKHRDLLGFLWSCRQDNSGCEMTEKQVFTIAGNVASALEYLHSRRCIHGNVGACSVLVGADMTAKLWGLGPAYRRRTSTTAVEEVGMKKWQAPEVLARSGLSQSSDIWSFGILLYEMVTLGGPPFAQVPVTELLQYLQRGKYLRQPSTCSSSLYSVMKLCGHYTPQRRPSASELIAVLHTGETSADGRRPLRVSEPPNFDRYMREAGLREAADSAFL